MALQGQAGGEFIDIYLFLYGAGVDTWIIFYSVLT